ncbi:MAG TPA: hypothetical protein VFG43_09290 [Geminicoccaceae bacterium]|nr:hypothetical protein [Geminicoccaceae bacterium]
MRAALQAGAAYFAVVFAAGFALGTLRVLVLVPRLGEAAVLLELPVMLALSWLACGRLLRRFAVPGGLRPRLLMAGTAFALLMAAELGLSALAFGRSVAQHVALWGTWPGALGLAAQLAFASFPLVRNRAPPGRAAAGDAE